MSIFTPAEIEYLHAQRLSRIATLGANGDLHVVPVRFRYNPELDTIELGGGGFGTSKKYRDAVRYGRVAVVIDDSPQPGKPRGIEVRGNVEAVDEGGEQLFRRADPQFIRVFPTYVTSWGIDTDSFHAVGRKVS